MSNMFSYDSKFMSTLQVWMDAFLLGVLWLACSIPVITAGAASTAFYYAYNKAVRRKLGYAGREFFRSFKDNFKQATKAWLIVLGVGALLVVNCYILLSAMQALPGVSVLLGIMLALLLGLVMWGSVLFPYIARFAAGLKQTLKNAAILVVANFGRLIVLVVVYAAVIAVALRVPYVGILMPTVYMYIANQIIERMFSKYIKSEETNGDSLDEN